MEPIYWIAICAIVLFFGVCIGMSIKEDSKPKQPLPILKSTQSNKEIAIMLMHVLRSDYDRCAGKCGEDHGLPRDVKNAADLNYAASRHLGVCLGDRLLGIFTEYTKIL
jgi:hypothetical protein